MMAWRACKQGSCGFLLNCVPLCDHSAYMIQITRLMDSAVNTRNAALDNQLSVTIHQQNQTSTSAHAKCAGSPYDRPHAKYERRERKCSSCKNSTCQDSSL